MTNEKEADSAATPDKSPNISSPTFQERFTAQLEAWRKEGCRRLAKGESETDPAAEFCGAAPHRSKMNKPVDGIVKMVVDCAAGHAEVWSFDVAEADLKAELKRNAEAAAEAEKNGKEGRDPMKASVKITLDLRTQEVAIDPWVPTPGMGLQLAAMLTAHFTALFNAGSKPAKLFTPNKSLVHPVNGKILVQ